MSATSTHLHRSSNQRRSQRVMLAVKILITGVRLDGQPFSQETRTSVVNAHGAQLLLAVKVSLGQLLTVRNLNSQQELKFAVVDVGPAQDGEFQVGIEFLAPTPRFWRVGFPPEDWSPRSPEAKRITLAPTPITKAHTSK